MVLLADQIDELEKKVISGLKDFQQATVNRIDELYRQGQKRILVSDEVGLGKTLIARGTVAKLTRLRKEEGNDLVKVVYICSNSAIADQNLEKLKISSSVRKESFSNSRLSMQHLTIFEQENDPVIKNSFIQLIPLTPDTSFRMTSGAGTVYERALMYAILRRIPSLKNYSSELEYAMEDVARSSWRGWARSNMEIRVNEVNKISNGEYLRYMINKLKTELDTEMEGGKTYKECILAMCKMIRCGKYIVNECHHVIRKLRSLFAKISLEKLEPDLVIMDEFQRFKYLINADPDSEMGVLSNKFFSSDDMRMLLLSATPYKMYSTLEEIDEADADEHFEEFLNVMKFLNVTAEANKRFREIWNNYSIQLKEFSEGNLTMIQAKNAAEEAMYENVCRTERISSKDNADIIDDSNVKTPIHVLEHDIQSYLKAQKLLDDIGAPFNIPVDYIKSTPYLMSFMRDYQLKRYVEKYFKNNSEELSKIKNDYFWLTRKSIDKYEKIPTNNARLDAVMSQVIMDNSELLLWVPPSKCYYEPQGVFGNVGNFSKTLIFSSWEMVPRMIANMVSYETERRTVGILAKESENRDAHYFSSGDKRYPSSRLNFSESNGTLSGMMLFCLIYPSRFLANCYNPIDCMNRNLSLKEIESEIKLKISEKLEKYNAPETGKVDKRWYYMAPLFMDGPGEVTNWFEYSQSLADYDEDEKTRKQKGFNKHIEKYRQLYSEMGYGRSVILGKKPADLVDILTDIAIASPAVCLYRTYSKYKDNSKDFAIYMPSQIARLFINRMNTVESTAAVELACGKKTDDAHWQNVLTYCKQGNMQSMFDEYAHLLVNGLDQDENMIYNLHSQISNSISFKTTVYNVDTYDTFRKRMLGEKEKAVGIRTHFAVAFIKGDNKESDMDRKKTVRNAFNSPFRPFVLASTSIGQEGLDFHNYCRKIVHWNLPSNPIDLEQREGRINRFECLAIRQNVAKRYGGIQFKKNVWNELFQEASRVEKTKGCSDLIPYWGLKESDDMIKIERIVPMYPFSRDVNTYERLIKILSLYRLTLGQARQEELLEYIFQNCERPEELKKMFINLSPFYRTINDND